MYIKKKQIEELKKTYYANVDVLKELENFINEHGVTDDGVTNANESFEQGYNNALEYVFKIFGIDYETKILKRNIRKHITLKVTIAKCVENVVTKFILNGMVLTQQ